MRPCYDRHPQPVPDQCRLCWLHVNDARYRDLWGPDRLPLSQRVWNFGKSLVRHVANGCPQAPAEVQAQRLAICQGCEHYDAARCSCRRCGCALRKKAAWALERCPLGKWESPPTVNLLCHVYPVAGNGTWQRNLDQLRRRWHLFNGKKIIGVVRDQYTDPPEAVQAYLQDAGVEWVVKDNDPGLREVATWFDLWGRLDARPGLTFWCHSKGVTKPVNPGVSVHRWGEIMYETCLDYLPLVAGLLEAHPIVGSFKKLGHGFGGSKSAWHYSGAFYWLRTDVGRDLYRTMSRVWYGVESWPGEQFTPAEGGVIFGEGKVPRLNLYKLRYLQSVIEPEYTKWRAANQQHRSATRSPTALSTAT